MKIRIGTSGWMYDDWRSNFYPEVLKKDKWLEFYGRQLALLQPEPVRV